MSAVGVPQFSLTRPIMRLFNIVKPGGDRAFFLTIDLRRTSPWTRLLPKKQARDTSVGTLRLGVLYGPEEELPGL